jgi:hypothetical protein
MSFDPKYFGVPPQQQIQKENRYAYTATSGQTTFAASYTAGFGPDVYYNGAHLDPRTQFTAVDGATVVLTTAADTGASVVIVAKAQQPNYNFYTQQETNALVANFYASATSGTTSAITATTNPSFSQWLFDGMEVKVRMTAANPSGTTAPTISFNGMSALTIVRDGQQPLTGGDWNATDEVTLRYSVAYNTLTLLTGKLTSITPAQLDNTSKYATTAFVQRALGNLQGVVSAISATTLTQAQLGSYVEITAGAPFTITLPVTSASISGGCFYFYNNISTAVTIAANGSQTINSGPINANTYTLSGYGSAIVTTDGASWSVIAQSGTASIAANGYQKLASGIIIQWGLLTLTSGTATYSLPIAFPTGGFAMTLSFGVPASGTANGTFLSTSTVSIQNTYTASQSGFFIAIGH